MQGFLSSRGDLTAKARIRNAALELFAAKGTSSTTMRQVAQAAGVTPGLVVHHYGSKEGLRREVDDMLIDRVSRTLDEVSTDGSPREVAERRNERLAKLFHENPVLVDYLRRSLLGSSEASDALFKRTLEFAWTEIRSLREAGLTRTDVELDVHALGVVMRMLGPLLLQPLVDHMERHMQMTSDSEDVSEQNPLPSIEVVVHYPTTG